MPTPTPKLTLSINFWTLWDQPSPDQPWTADERLRQIKAAGFDACCFPETTPDLKQMLETYGLRFGGAMDAGSVEQFAPKIRSILEIGDGPINCQLADHDTPVDKAISLTVALMEEAAKQRAQVHVEMHRDTCTETPEKTYAIAEGVKKITGRYPLINFDFSHPASVKHLSAANYVERLFENVGLFQMSTLWHMRPFNGHHCQVPVTDGKGNFSPEYMDLRPFIHQAFVYWLEGPRPGNELWVVPELGPFPGYGLSCFPNTWDEAIILGNDLKKIWNETVTEVVR